MEYKILYEAPLTGVPFPWTAIGAGAVCLILAVIMIVFRKKIKFIAGLTLFFFAFMCLYIAARGFIDYVDRRDNIWAKYVSEDYLVAEGTVKEYTENYNGKIGVDCFKVGEERFTVGNVGYFGYRLTKSMNGGIANDKAVRITYVPHGFDNIILKLEVKE